MAFKIYTDFESMLREMQRVNRDTNSNASYTDKYQDHFPCSFAYQVVCIHD